MAHPYKSAGHKNDPRWFSGVKKWEDSVAVNDQSKERLAKANQRNYGGDQGARSTANYQSKAERKLGRVS